MQVLASEELSPPNLGQGAGFSTLPLNQLAAMQTEGCGSADKPGMCKDSASGSNEPERESPEGTAVADGRMSPHCCSLQQPAAAEPAACCAVDSCRTEQPSALDIPRVRAAGNGAASGAGSLPGAAAAGWEGWDWASCEASAGFHGVPRASGAPRGPDTSPWLALDPRPSSPSPSRCPAAPSRLRWPTGQAGLQQAAAPAGAPAGGGPAQESPAMGDPVLACVRAWLPHDLAASAAYLRDLTVVQARMASWQDGACPVCFCTVLDKEQHPVYYIQQG